MTTGGPDIVYDIGTVKVQMVMDRLDGRDLGKSINATYWAMGEKNIK